MHERAKDEIRHQIDTLFRSYAKRDWTAMLTQHDEKWRGFSVDAQSILRGHEAHVAQTQAMMEDIELIDYEMMEIDYVFHGTICVVPYIARLRSSRKTGKIVEIKIRVLDVYAQQDAGWHQVASHMSLHPDVLAAP